MINTKYIRVKVYKNDCPKLQGAVGLYYDSCRELDPRGPETVELMFYFYTISIEIGPSFND